MAPSIGTALSAGTLGPTETSILGPKMLGSTALDSGQGPEYADVVFLVDSSDHLGTKSFPFVRTFLNKMISSLPIEANKYRVALAQYSHTLHNEFHLGAFRSRNPMLNHLKKNFRFIGGSLKIRNALQEAHQTYFSAPTNGRDRKEFPPILVVLASAESKDDVEEASKALREDRVKIISVGVQKASEENLKAMATSQFHFNLQTVRDLSTFSSNMTQIIKDVTKYSEGAGAVSTTAATDADGVACEDGTEVLSVVVAMMVILLVKVHVGMMVELVLLVMKVVV
ncbi:collagen alpha-6(VI) chain-like [Nannospalax galili]|uniref:collagen alpha-6(VI) chain-like n=1 Tax=Nannospalax galili TaxID=1026970 RepID=UPI0004ED6E85|nr:collagen alpha-6(VI) chain-like [Nannospalax galili]